MNKFFVSNEIYKERMSICKSCVYYSSVLGNCTICKCFMKIKSRIATLSCPQKYWLKTTDVEKPDDLPEEIIKEIIKVWEDLKTGRAKDQAAKRRMIEIYNTIYMTSYSTNTNCGSCISTCFNEIKRLYYEYSKDYRKDY